MWVCPQTTVRTSSGSPAERLGPALQAGVDEHHLVVVSRGAMAEGHRAEAPHVEDDRVRQAREQVHVRGRELRGRPGVDRVGLFVRRELAAGERHQVAVGVAAHEHDVVQRGEPVEDLRGLRPGGVVAADHDPVGRPDRQAAASTASSTGSTPWISARTATLSTMPSSSHRCAG